MKLYRYDYANAYTGAESKEEAIGKFQLGGFFNGFLANDGNVHEVEADGFAITVTAVQTADKQPSDMDKNELKQWLKSKNIDFVPQWGEDKLRELVLQHAS